MRNKYREICMGIAARLIKIAGADSVWLQDGYLYYSFDSELKEL